MQGSERPTPLETLAPIAMVHPLATLEETQAVATAGVAMVETERRKPFRIQTSQYVLCGPRQMRKRLFTTSAKPLVSGYS